MERLFLLFLLVVSSQFSLTVPAKWTNMENWRKIKDNMPEATVEKLLGTPKYTRESYSSLTMYYSSREPVINKKNKIEYNYDGYITLYRNFNASRAVYEKVFRVSNIVEPDFNKIKEVQIEPPKKLKPRQKLEKWQIEKNWKKIKWRMNDKAIVNILGEPVSKKSENAHWRYYYGIGNEEESPLGGYVLINKTVGDNNNTVESWSEPFWYLLNKELYEEVKPEVDVEKTETEKK